MAPLGRDGAELAQVKAEAIEAAISTKRNGEYMQKSKFNISSADQARDIISALQEWTKE